MTVYIYIFIHHFFTIMCVVFTTGQLIRVATVTRTKTTDSYWRSILLRRCWGSVNILLKSR